MSDSRSIGASPFLSNDQPKGFGAQFEYNEKSGQIIGKVTIDSAKEGPPKHAHGGSLATLIDEAMGACCWMNGHKVLAANLNINFKKPVPLNTELTIIGEVDHVDGRKIHTKGHIRLPDGTITTEGTGLFIVAPTLFEEHDYEDNPFQFKEQSS